MRRPAITENVLVEVFTRTDSEKKSARHHRRRGCRCLRYNRRMDSYSGAGDARSKSQTFGGMGDGSNHAPYKWALPLAINPGVKMIRDQSESESRLFGEVSVVYEIVRPVLFTGER